MLQIQFAGSVPKQGVTAAGNEDRFAFRRTTMGGVRAAIADGASSTLFSGVWAELLSSAFVAQEGTTADLPALEGLRRNWYEAATRLPIAWHQQAQLSQGAAAALLGVVVEATGEWRAVVVGDCALFVVRQDICIATFPAQRADELSAFPVLLQTHPRSTSGKEVLPMRVQGVLEPDDSLYLMTDALAICFLSEIEKGRFPWKWFQDVQTDPVFAQRIRELKGAGRLKDDDATVLHIKRAK